MRPVESPRSVHGPRPGPSAYNRAVCAPWVWRPGFRRHPSVGQSSTPPCFGGLAMKRFLLAVAVALAVAPLSPQAQVARSSKWTLPRTPDGHPDLQGLWTTQTYTPLQRPDRYAGKEFLTEAEAAEFTR